jgi:hypothetical protein
MPAVSAEMVDWWFDWHPRDPRRYRAGIRSPTAATRSSQRQCESALGGRPSPGRDVGTGTVHARIAFVAPTEFGFSTDALDEPRVGTIVCGWVGDDRRRTRHSAMAHVFLVEDGGLVLRSRFLAWCGNSPLPARRAGRPGRFRNLAWPRDLAPAPARHCAEEYGNLAVLLPHLHDRSAAAS